jgi:hypothetical protein
LLIRVCWSEFRRKSQAFITSILTFRDEVFRIYVLCCTKTNQDSGIVPPPKKKTNQEYMWSLGWLFVCWLLGPSVIPFLLLRSWIWRRETAATGCTPRRDSLGNRVAACSIYRCALEESFGSQRAKLQARNGWIWVCTVTWYDHSHEIRGVLCEA